jgi:hypothetical protein
VAPAKIFPQAVDEAVATRLWEASERLTGVQWPDTAERRDVVAISAKKEA